MAKRATDQLNIALPQVDSCVSLLASILKGKDQLDRPTGNSLVEEMRVGIDRARALCG